MKVTQAYRFALEPTPEQQIAFVRHCDAQRRAYNWRLGVIKDAWEKRRAEQEAGVPEDQRTPLPSWNYQAALYEWRNVRDEVAPWWNEISAHAFGSGLRNLQHAFQAWNASRTGKRPGPKVRFPRFKSKRKTRPSYTLFGVYTLGARDRRHVRIPRVGLVRTAEPTTALASRLEEGSARIRQCTIGKQGGRWHISYTCDVDKQDRGPRWPQAMIGVDVGINHLAILSDGSDPIPNPRPLKEHQRRLRLLQRRVSRRVGPDRRTGQQPSHRWHKAQADVTRIHARVANLRHDHLDKLTTRLADTYGTVVIEDLNVKGMLGNRRSSRAISDSAWGELRRQLEYKVAWRGGTLVVADRWYPSSKTCSSCGKVKEKLPLRVRVYRCEHCGFECDRDVNAARNLADLVKLVPETRGRG